LDVSKSGGTVTDKQGRVAVANLVTAGSRGTAATTAELTAMAARYMAIARPANRELDHEFDGFDDHVKDGDLAAARADLRAAVVTERRFDRQLIALSFPPPTEPFVRLLYRVNQARVALTSTAAGVTALRELRGYAKRLDAANGPVQDAVRVIRAQLGLPPADTS
jgi:DNA-binding GntR family transcriptional regulator